MNASLNKKLRDVKWGEYEVGKLFKFDSSNGIFHAVNLKIFDTQIKGSFPYVVRTSQNNGIKGFIVENKKALNPGNTISFAQDTAEVFYREQPYFTGNKVKIVSFRNKNICLNKSIATFLIPILKSGFRAFSWGSSFETSLLEKVSISLPQTSDGKIDFDFMESFVAELEAERVAELSAYLKVSRLDNYELSSDEAAIIDFYKKNQIVSKEFRFVDVFNSIKQGRRLKKEDQCPGNIPFVMSGTTNTGVFGYVSNPIAVFPKNSITIDIFGNSFYRNYGFGAGDDTGVYWSSVKQYSKSVMLFFTAAMKKALSGKFSYGKKLRSSQSLHFKMQLPAKDGKPDYKTMELLISAIQKLVIKDVVQFTNRKLDTYKNIVSKGSIRYQISEQRSMIVASADESCLDY